MAESLLFRACERGDARQVARILQDHPELSPNVTGGDGNTPMHIACAWGQLAVVQALLRDRRVSLTCENSAGCTPLHGACFHSYEAVVRLLLDDHRASLSPTRVGGSTALHLACYRRDTNLVEILLANSLHPVPTSHKLVHDGEHLTAIELACRRGSSIAVQLLEQYEKKPRQTRRQLRSRLG